MKDWLRTFGHPDPDPESATGYAISSSTESLVVSILSAGTFFGALMGAPVAGKIYAHYSPHVAYDLRSRYHRQKVGHYFRLSHILCRCCYANCINRHPSVCMSLAHTMPRSVLLMVPQVVGRVFAGLGVGLVSCLIPMYQSEWYVPAYPGGIQNLCFITNQLTEMDSWCRCINIPMGHHHRPPHCCSDQQSHPKPG